MTDAFERQLNDNTPPASEEHEEIDDVVHRDDEPKQRSIPKPILIGGFLVVFVGGMFLYKKFTAPPQNVDQYSNAHVQSLPADQPAAGGMMGANQQMPVAVTTAPQQAAPTYQPPPQPAVTTAAVQPPFPGSQPTTTQSAAGEPTNSISTSPPAQPAEVNTSSNQSADIDELKKAVKEIKDELAKRPSKAVVAAETSEKPTTAHSRKRVATTPKQTRPDREVLVGFHVKQVIPGQGWVENEQTGKQQVVSVGDKIGTAEVTKIDDVNYRIHTTAGTIE